MNKLSKRFATLFLGLVTALGVGLVGSNVDKKGVKAAEGDTVATFVAADVGGSSSYGRYTNTNWVLTFGGNVHSGGTNSNSTNRGNCRINHANDTKYLGDTGVTSSNTAFAIASLTPLNDIAKIDLKYNGGSNNTRGDIYLVTSSDNTTFTKVTLTGAVQQGHAVPSSNSNVTITFEFDTLVGGNYFAIIIRDSGTSGNYRYDYLSTVFYEGATGPVETQPVKDFLTAVGKIPGTVVLTDACRDLIIAAELAYAALTGEDLTRVDTEYAAEVTTMQNARAAYDGLVAANAINVANDFIGRVHAIFERGAAVGDKDTIDALEIEYQGLLGVAAVAAILNASAVESELATIRTQLDAAIIAADQAAAGIVIGLIDALPAVGDLTIGHAGQVSAARVAHDALTEAQKGLVTNLSLLVAAEAKIIELDPSASAAEVYTIDTKSADWDGTTYGAAPHNLTHSFEGKSLIWVQNAGQLASGTAYLGANSNNVSTMNVNAAEFSGVKPALAAVPDTNARVGMLRMSNFYVNKPTEVTFNWTTIAGTQKVYVIASTDSGTTWDIIVNNGTATANGSATWQGLDYISTDGVMFGIVITSTSDCSIRNISASIKGIGEVTTEYNAGAVEVSGVTMEPKTLSLDIGEVGNIGVTVAPANANNKDYTLESDTPSVATVAQDGTVTAVGVGTAIITVTTDDGGFTDTCVVTVSGAATVKKEISARIFDGNDVEDFNGLAFGLTTTGNIAYKGFISGKGAQIGSGSQSGTVTIATTIARFNPSDIDRVVLNVSLSSGSGSGTVRVMVGDTQIGEAVTLTNTATRYEFVGAQVAGMKKALGQDAGQLMIVADIAASGLCIGEFSLYGAAEQVALAQEDAILDLIELMNDSDTCDDFDLAPDLRDMYDGLTPEEKELFDLQTYIADGGIEDTLLNKLVYMEYLLSLEGPTPSGSTILEALSDTNTLVVMIIAILGLSALAGYYFIEKKRLAA